MAETPLDEAKSVKAHAIVNLLTGELATEAKRKALDRRKNRTKTEQEEKVDVMAWYSKMKAEL